MSRSVQDYVARAVELEDQVRGSEEWRLWQAADPKAKQQTEARLRETPAYRQWHALGVEAHAAGVNWEAVEKEVHAQLDKREAARRQRQAQQEADTARLRAEQEARSRVGLGGRVVTSQPLGDVPDTDIERARRLETARSWAPADLAAQIKSIEPHRILGIRWGLKITLHNHDVMKVTNRSMRHGGTEAAVRLSAALSRELGWQGQALGGNPVAVRRTAVILAAEGIHVTGRTPASRRLVRDALAEAGLANPQMPRRRPESAKRQQARQKMTDELLARWTSPVQTTTPGAAPATPTGPGVSP